MYNLFIVLDSTRYGLERNFCGLWLERARLREKGEAEKGFETK